MCMHKICMLYSINKEREIIMAIDSVPYILQGKNIILVLGGKSHTISRDTHMNYEKIVAALKDSDWDTLGDLVEPKKAIINFGRGFVTVEDGIVMWKEEPFHNALSVRMLEMYQEGFPVDPMINFMENLMDNPSKRSVEQVYGFLEKNSLPITEDGYFLAFKKVNTNYKDLHTRTIDNSIGQIVEMERNLVDDNPDSYCSSGLHFCSESYLAGFGCVDDPVMILKINPADVVSIPTDYDGAKGRCCRYEVVGQVGGDPKEAFNEVVNREYSPKAKTTTLSRQSAWPFTTSPDVPSGSWPFPKDDCSDDCGGYTCVHEDGEFEFEDEDEDQLYDLVRVYGGWVEYTDMTLEEATDRVEKNSQQKKAMLKIVLAGTDEELE